VINLIQDCRTLERRLVALRLRKEEVQNEISECEKALSITLFQIEEVRTAEINARQKGE
jgi:hypothetical protein